MSVVLVSGTLAGLLLFAIQHFTIVPLIKKAETYELSAHHHDEAHSNDEEWAPAEGAERTFYTALTTVLGAIGFSAIVFGIVSFTSVALNWRKGAFLGLLAFICVNLAPAFGLPPEPPGVPAADLFDRQLWWVGTIVATGLGLWLIQLRKPRGICTKA